MKVLRGIAIIMMLIGWLIIFCAAGASDHNQLSLAQIVILGGIGLVVFVIGFAIMAAMGDE